MSVPHSNSIQHILKNNILFNPVINMKGIKSLLMLFKVFNI